MRKSVYKILIVDDEATHRKKIARLLKRGLEDDLRQEVQLDDAVTVEEGKDKLLNAPNGGFDLAILDWLIDDPSAISSSASNGATLLHWMQNPELDLDTEAIMLTGHGSEQVELDILAQGAYAYVCKPDVFRDANAPQEDGTLGGPNSKAFLFHVRNCMTRRRMLWRKEQILRVLQELHRELSGIHDTERRLHAIVRCAPRINADAAKATIRIRSGLEHQRVAIWLNAELEDDNVNAGAVLKVKDGIAGHVFQTGEPYWCKDVRMDPHFVLSSKDTKSELCVPVFGRERGDGERDVIAVINLESPEEDAFNEEDAKFFQMLAEVVSLTIQDTTLLQHIFEMAGEINSAVLPTDISSGHVEPYLNALSRVETERLIPLFETVLSNALRVTDADAGAVFLVHRDDHEIRLVAEKGMGAEAKAVMQSVSIDAEKSIGAEVCRSGKTMMATDPERDQEKPLWNQYGPFYDRIAAGSFLCVPMPIGNEVIGCIDVESRYRLTFSPLDAQVLGAYGRMAATAIANLALMVSIESRTLEEMKAGLISLAAHEVLGPVHKVGMAIESCELLLEQGKRDKALARLVDASNKVKEASKHVRKVLELAAGGNFVTSTNVDLYTILRDVADQACRVGDEFHIELPNKPLSPIIVRGQPHALRLVVRELIENARKACIGMPDGFIRISMQITDGRVRVTFLDNGPGIPHGLKSHLFESPQDSLGGGFGLHKSRVFMQLYDGDLRFIENDQGAAFQLLLAIPNA